MQDYPYFLSSPYVSFLLFIWIVSAAADDNATDLFEAFPQLADLQLPWHPSLAGGQNFTRCCIQAVYDSLHVIQGEIAFDPTSQFVNVTLAELKDSEFPCGADYQGSNAGAPVVAVPYSWCVANCAGWEMSSNTVLTQWVQPFVGFILPAAVFCLNVPRRKALTISDSLFHDHMPQLRDRWKSLMRRILNIERPLMGLDGHVKRAASMLNTTHKVVKRMGPIGWLLDLLVKLILFLLYACVVLLEMVLRGSFVALVALFDTLIWLVIVFSAAAPMTLSGLYEASIDRVVMEALNKALRLPADESNNSTLKHHVHLLYGILIGNLELTREASEVEDNGGSRSAWNDIQFLVEAISEDSPQTHAAHRQAKTATHVRLSTMLGCQADFGASVGAAVVFFLGSFLFSVFGNLSMLGDNDTSHALAFGMWWMTIPYVAVVSGCLLAGNNPNTLEAIFLGVTTTWPVRLKAHPEGAWAAVRGFARTPYGFVYDSVYQPVWIWERGRNKRNWIREIQSLYGTTRTRKKPGLWRPVRDWARGLHVKYGNASELLNYSAPVPQNLPDLDFLDWLHLFVVAAFLIIGPFTLAFVTSYYTPYVGLSCRSLTFLVYFLFQLWLSAIWFWDLHHTNHFAWWMTIGTGAQRRYSVPTPTALATLFGLFGAAFTAIVGTVMQLLGLYRNCRCIVPITYWFSPGFQDVRIPISTNSAESIYYARLYWLPTGWASILLMVGVCYTGWWYQRHWRRIFLELTDKALVSAPDTRQDLSLVATECKAEEEVIHTASI